MVNAMKSRDVEVVSLLRVAAGEFGRVGKDLTDEQVIKVLRTMTENAKELGNLNEVVILSKYLPNMLGDTQLKTIIGGIIHKNQYSGMQDMGKVMSTIKTHPMKSQIDGKLASNITRELLTH
ncbi:MAG: GatB/YqeY domain-containing protein [Dehalococcoidales bacterium]